MSNIKIKLFQIPSVTVDNVQITFPFKRVDALLYYMICKKTASRSEIVDLLWENSDEESGFKNLRHTLYTLKKCFGFELLISPQKSTLQLNPDIQIDSDYDDFVNNHCFSAYGGLFLQGFSVKNTNNFDIWVQRERDKLQDRYLQKLFENVRLCIDKKETATAEKYAIDYLCEDPLDEQMTVLLMQLYKDSQSYHKASKIYQRFKKQIAEDLGITPLNETTALYYEIMNEWNDTTAQPDDSALQGLSVGRAGTLDVMRHLFKDFKSSIGKRCSIVLSGEQGCGKTHVLNAFLEEPEISGAPVFSGFCYRTTVNNPFTPWNTIMLSIAKYVIENDIKLPESVKNSLAEIFSVFSTDTISPSYVPPRRCAPSHIDAVAMMFSILTHQKKSILVIEDINWIDSASLELLDAILRRVSSGSLMIILTSVAFLPPYIKKFVTSAISDNLLTQIDVPCLSFDDTKLFLLRNLDKDLEPAAIKKIYEETDGNPYLLNELVTSIRQNGSFDQIAPSNHNIMVQRLVGLSTQARQVTDIISLFPDYAPCELLASITDKNTAELLNIYEELKERSLVIELKVHNQSVLSFTHNRLREIVYQEQSYFKRKPLHLRVARLIERQNFDITPSVCNQLIHHYQYGGDFLGSLKYKIIGLEMYSSCMHEYPSILQEDSDYSEFDFAKDLKPYLAELTDDIAELKKISDDPLLLDRLEGMLLCTKGRYGIFIGDYELALDAINRILNDPTFQLDSSIMLKAYRFMVLYCARVNDMEQVERRISAGLTLSENCADDVEHSRFLLLKGYYFSRIGEFDRSSYYISEATDRFLHLPNSRKYRMFIMSTYHYMGENKRKEKDFAGACIEYKTGLSILGDITDKPGISALYTDYARAAFALGDHSKAKELFKISCESYEVTNELLGRVTALAYYAYYLMLEGNYDVCVKYLENAHHYAQLGGIVQDNGMYWYILAMLRQRLDMAHSHKNVLDDYLQKPLKIYCQKSLNLLSQLPYCYETDLLNEILYYGSSKSRPYTARELYSQNKHFMTE